MEMLTEKKCFKFCCNGIIYEYLFVRFFEIVPLECKIRLCDCTLAVVSVLQIVMTTDSVR